MLVRLVSTTGSRCLKIAALLASALLSLYLYTEFVHTEYSIRHQLPTLGEKLSDKLGGYGHLFSSPADADDDAQDAAAASSSGIPKKIWYKLGPKGKNDDIRAWTGTCIEQNPDYAHEFVDDAWADAWVERTFAADRPDVVDVYLRLTVPILKADLLRYLLLWAEGGVWFDLDVSCEGIPIDAWVPDTEELRANASIVVGWEFDYGWDESFFHEFASWTILSRPGVSHMLAVVDDIVAAVHEVAREKQVPIEGLTPPMVGDIVDFTGPRRLTRSILASVGRARGREVERKEVENIRQPVLVDNVLILPGQAFSDATNDFGSDGGRPGPVLVTHHYAGSWKNEHGGELARRRRRSLR